MTYKELLEELKTLNEEQLNQDVTIQIENIFEDNDCEFFKILQTDTTLESDVLDENHFYLKLKL